MAIGARRKPATESTRACTASASVSPKLIECRHVRVRCGEDDERAGLAVDLLHERDVAVAVSLPSLHELGERAAKLAGLVRAHRGRRRVARLSTSRLDGPKSHDGLLDRLNDRPTHQRAQRRETRSPDRRDSRGSAQLVAAASVGLARLTGRQAVRRRWCRTSGPRVRAQAPDGCTSNWTWTRFPACSCGRVYASNRHLNIGRTEQEHRHVVRHNRVGAPAASIAPMFVLRRWDSSRRGRTFGWESTGSPMTDRPDRDHDHASTRSPSKCSGTACSRCAASSRPP